MKKEYRRVAGGSITGGIIIIVIALVAYGAFAIYFALGKEKDPVLPYIILCGVAPAISLALIAAGIFTIVEALRKKKILANGTKKQCQIIDLFARHVRYVDTYHMVATYKGESGRLYKVNYPLSKEQYYSFIKGYVFDCVVYKEDCYFNQNDVNAAHR